FPLQLDLLTKTGTMNTQRCKLFCGVALLYCLAATAIASTPSPYQPSYRPLGLSVIASTQLASSDSISTAFQALEPTYLNYVKAQLPEGVVFTGASLNQLDPQKLYFMFDYAPRVYYLMEGACYSNALGATIATAS